MTKYSTSSCDKSLNVLLLDGHWYIRTEKHWYDKTDESVLTNGTLDDNDGVIPGAVRVPDQEVAEMFAEAKRRESLLSLLEESLVEWIQIRRSRTRKAREKKPKQFQKQKQTMMEVTNN